MAADGAPDENRTHVSWLEARCSTIELLEQMLEPLRGVEPQLPGYESGFPPPGNGEIFYWHDNRVWRYVSALPVELHPRTAGVTEFESATSRSQSDVIPTSIRAKFNAAIKKKRSGVQRTLALPLDYFDQKDEMGVEPMM